MTMETKGLTCKIPLDLHNQISEEIRETESTMSKFIEMIIREHYEKGANRIMEKGRTLVWRCISRLEFGTKYCQHSPSFKEPILHQAILNLHPIGVPQKKEN